MIFTHQVALIPVTVHSIFWTSMLLLLLLSFSNDVHNNNSKHNKNFYAHAFSIAKGTSVKELLQIHSSKLQSLQEIASKYPNAPTDDIFYLRYCVDETNNNDLETQLKSNLEWREGEGRSICATAQKAFHEATLDEKKWNNEPIRTMAPHSTILNTYISTPQCITTSTRTNDLVYCIRAGKIDDTSLMTQLSVDQMTEFFLYIKEIQALEANRRSVELDRLVAIIVANDLSGVKLVGGGGSDASFRKALSASSKKGNELYPNLAGPTLLLNLPRLLGVLVKLFTPLFPKEVQAKLRFESGPLVGVEDLLEIASSVGDRGTARETFLDQLDELVYK
mmetsp:Transcript_6980/g.10017  ORF Transcript_6980/g.10017 Transcript_6980/m.10017 type:complete len:335 (+) Transcript_6980:98-1102(+)